MSGIPPPPHKTKYFSDYNKATLNKSNILKKETSGMNPVYYPTNNLSSSTPNQNSYCLANNTAHDDMQYYEQGPGELYTEVIYQKERQILDFIKQFPRPVSTKEIIQNCGHFFKHPIMPILYGLHNKSMILKVQGYGVQSWKINPETVSHATVNLKRKFAHIDDDPIQTHSKRSGGQLHNRTGPLQHTSNISIENSSTQHVHCPASTSAKSAYKCKMSSSERENFLSADVFNALNKNPVSALNEMFQKKGEEVTYEVLNSGYGFKNKFTVAAKINGKLYDAVTCSSMKEARRDAADAALRYLLAKAAENDLPSQAATMNPMTHFDEIAMLSHQAYLKVSASVKEKISGRKVVACMIQENSYNNIKFVVALGSGNRCITGERLSLEGKVVNDSHAEIVCRRAFQRYLYSQVECSFENKHSIFEQKMNGPAKLKDGISFHLYISTAPCGDGALFTPQSNAKSTSSTLRDHYPTFSSKVHGILRSKIEDGEGTIPIEIRTSEPSFDGILRGERLRTMSCSDKICRWNILGLQGALLSHLIEPIYLDSLTLGYLYDHGHISRAVCCRITKNNKSFDNELPMPFYLNHPWIGRVSRYEPSRETEKTNNISINWVINEPLVEVTDGRTGSCLSRCNNAPTPSRLCKYEMYKFFIKVVSKSNSNKELVNVETYKELKESSTSFQDAKKCMFDNFKKLKYGQWIQKPREQEMFSLT